MSATWGERFRLTIFGESHGPSVGVVLDGVPAGLVIDPGEIAYEMLRRAPGRGSLSTPRKETDEARIQSGVLDGRATGAPICAIIENRNTSSSDYDDLRETPRPGHADYTGSVKFRGFNDHRGGGHFSGRLTAPIVFAGAVARIALRDHGVQAGAQILSVGEVGGRRFDPCQTAPEALRLLRELDFPALENAELMKAEILAAKNEQDSVGGVVECVLTGLPAGAGEPFFDSIESRIAGLVFSIPAVKGIDFGDGFGLSKLRGSQANDAFVIRDGAVLTETNRAGGVLGGISTGMPVVFRTAFKPTPSIAKSQRTVNLQSLEETRLTVRGRHDPCIVQRAVPVVEAAALIAALDLMLVGGIF